ncbi:MAG: TRAP transporter small permease [Balneolaceae bacterium]|nr:TRAP transporter small permease [Balneolaceae bacterium]
MRDKMNTALKGLLVTLMLLIVLSVVWQVFSRYVLRSPSTVTTELARYLLIWISLFGAAYVSGEKMHLAIDLLPRRLSPVWNRRVRTLIYLLIISFVVLVMIVGGSRLVYITFILEQTSPALQIPLAYVYTVLPLSGCLIVLYKLLDIRALYAANPNRKHTEH